MHPVTADGDERKTLKENDVCALVSYCKAVVSSISVAKLKLFAKLLSCSTAAHREPSRDEVVKYCFYFLHGRVNPRVNMP